MLPFNYFTLTLVLFLVRWHAFLRSCLEGLGGLVGIGFVCEVCIVGVCGSVLHKLSSVCWVWIWLCVWWDVYVWDVLDNWTGSGWVEGGSFTYGENMYNKVISSLFLTHCNVSFRVASPGCCDTFSQNCLKGD